jgi:hypothetical protein
MRKYHHIGIPSEKIEYRTVYYDKIKGFATPFEDSEYGVEYVKFDEDSPLPEVVKNKVHIAFEVDDFEKEMNGEVVLVEPYLINENIEHAFILHRGIAVEFIKFINK